VRAAVILLMMGVAGCNRLPTDPWPPTDAQIEGTRRCHDMGMEAVFLHDPEKVLCNKFSKKKVKK
jgi:hypothetical protein